MTELALYIDIEGFGKKFNNGSKMAFVHLTNDLYSLGTNYFKNISIVQFGGDGYLIKEIILYSNSISYFVDISAALMQSIAIRGAFGRVQISSGYMSDISGLYSDGIQKQLQANNHNILSGSNYNVMHINSVIGTSIINCYKLKGPKGPLLLLDNNLENSLVNENVIFKPLIYEEERVISINWLKHRNTNTQCILNHLNLDINEIEKKIVNYINDNDLTKEWKDNALSLFE